MNNFDLKIGKMEQRNTEDTALFKLLRERLDNNNTDIGECVKIYNSIADKEATGGILTKEEIYTQIIITKILDDYHYWKGDMDSTYGYVEFG